MICVNSACRGSAYGSSLLTHSTRGPRKVRAGYEMTAWEGRFGEDAERDGLRVPLGGGWVGMPLMGRAETRVTRLFAWHSLVRCGRSAVGSSRHRRAARTTWSTFLKGHDK